MLRYVKNTVFSKDKIKPTTSKRKLFLIQTQRIISRVLAPIGLVVKVDINYHGSYIFGAENMAIRFDQEVGKKYTKVISRYVSSKSVVLDIGCSVGRVEKFLAPIVEEIYAVDISPKAIKLGKTYCKEHGNCHLYVNNGKDLGIFEDNKFDLIFSLETFGHIDIEDTFCYFIESFRCLKPGGKVLFQFYSFKQSLDQFAYQSILGDRVETRWRFATQSQLQLLLERVGFEIKYIQDGGFEERPDCIWILARKPLYNSV